MNINKDKINKIDLLKPFEKLIIERNEVLGCSMILEEYITDRGNPLMFNEEKSLCLGEIKIGFDRAFGATSSWEIDYCWIPCTNGGFRTRTETGGGSVVCGGIESTSRTLLRAGQSLEEVTYKETISSEKFYAIIKFDFGMIVGS